MRSTLVAAGDPNLPIYLTETGQPALPGTAGATRAATLSLTGDALARSDCNVQGYDVYGLIGSGTDLGPIDEEYMGIYDYMTDALNITDQALIAASQRWMADPTSGLVLWGAAATPASDLLPVGLSRIHTSPTCVSATVTYGG